MDLDNLKDLLIELWQLRRELQSMGITQGSLAIRSTMDRIADILEVDGCSFVDLRGRQYDPGMSVDVLHVENENGIGVGKYVIKEMITPVILRRNMLLCHGQVILEKSKVNEKGD